MEATLPSKRAAPDAEEPKPKASKPSFTYDEYSFGDLDENHQAALEYFREHGFVVLRGVLTERCVDAGHDEFMHMLSEASGGAFKRYDRSTWVNANLPFDHRGINNFSYGFVSVLHSRFQWYARTDPKLRQFFEHVFDTDNIWPSVDRMCFMRPGSKNRTVEYFWHWDQNPLKDPGFCRVQGLVALKDCPVECGGFQVVPDSHKSDFTHYGSVFARAKGAVSHDVTASDMVNVPSGEEGRAVWSRGIKVPLRKGDIVLWDSRTAHGNFPNTSKTDYRLVAYLTYGVAPPRGTDVRRALENMRIESFKKGTIMHSNRAAFFGGFQPGRWTSATPERNHIPTPSYRPPWDVILDRKAAGLSEQIKN